MKLIFTLVLFVVFTVQNVYAQSVTANGTSLSVQGAGIGWSTTASFPTQTTLTPLSSTSSTLIVSGFDFSAVPANATITGFSVTINRVAVGLFVLNNRISLVKNSVLQSFNAAPLSIWPTTATPVTYGNSTDTWGGSPWNRTDLNANFGVSISLTDASFVNVTGIVNSVSVTVFFNVVRPIILTKFEISRTAENHVRIQFATSTEERVKNLFVERSSDGRNFSPLFTIAPQGARNRVTNYSVLDKTPLPGTNYYRLKELDQDGNVAYFEIKSISISRSGPRFQAFYNGSDIRVNVSGIKGSFALMLYDAGGNLLTSKRLDVTSGSLQTTLPAPQRSGVYTVTMRGDGITETTRMFISK